MKRKAFTLIELLVVIAIIAVFAQAKVAAKKTVDLASVKQTNLSTIMYAADVDDMAPGQNNEPTQGWARPWNAGAGQTLGYMQPIKPGNTGSDEANDMLENWGRGIQPYVKSLQLLVSPAAPKPTDGYWGYTNTAGAGNATWMMNGAIQHQSMTACSAPAELVVYESALSTTRESRTQPVRDNGFEGIGGPRCHSIDVDAAGNTFGKGGNYGWLDGHASFKIRTALTYRNMGASGTVRIKKGPSAGDKPNTTALNDSTKPEYMDWTTSAYCDLSNL